MSGPAARALAALAVLGCAATLGGCLGGDSGSTDSSRELSKGIPAQIDQHPDGFVSRDVVNPLVNAWRAASTTRFTQVDAGALTADRTVGALAIFRYDFVSVVQDTTLVKVIGAGAVRITGAPTGDASEDSAQERGRIRFVGEGGIHGTLDLGDDSVRLRH